MSDILDTARAIVMSRKSAYERTFDGIDGNIVLEDLAKFCRANETTFNEDPRIHAVLEGRREVWLRIQKYLNITPDELWQLTRKD